MTALVAAALVLASFSSPLAELPSDRESATLVFTGDTLIHGYVASAARVGPNEYDFRSMFDPIRHIVGPADLAVCHLEVPLDPTSTTFSGYPLFSSPAEIADALAYAGFDACSTASNHTFDRGVQGVADTLDVLEAAGLQGAGSARTESEARTPVIYTAGDLTVGHVSATYWLNGLRLPEDKPWLVQGIDRHDILNDALAAKRAGADLVVLSLHCCTEYVDTPTPRQVELTHDLIGSSMVDLIVTHHSHWVGPVEEVDGEFVFHGLGNFISGQTLSPRTADGLLAVVEAEKVNGEWRFTSVEAVPTKTARYTYDVTPVDGESASYARTMGTLAAMGVDVAPYALPSLTGVDLALIE